MSSRSFPLLERRTRARSYSIPDPAHQQKRKKRRKTSPGCYPNRSPAFIRVLNERERGLGERIKLPLVMMYVITIDDIRFIPDHHRMHYTNFRFYSQPEMINSVLYRCIAEDESGYHTAHVRTSHFHIIRGRVLRAVTGLQRHFRRRRAQRVAQLKSMDCLRSWNVELVDICVGYI